MGGRSPESSSGWDEPLTRRSEPSLVEALGLALALFFLLIANGRPIGAGDTRPTERVAASFVQQGNLDVDEYADVEPPFVRQEGEHKVSIYPVFPALLASPVFALAQLFFALDETGMAFAGKLAAALFSALAAGVMFLAVGRRRDAAEGVRMALVFALGTSVWSTSQALWQHPAAVLFLSIAVLWTLRAEDDPAWAGRAGLPLALAVAARHADIALAAALAVGLAVRWPRRIPSLLLWSLPGVAVVVLYQWFYFGSPLRHGFSGSLGRFSEPWGVGHAGLLVSPAKGLFVFTPVALFAVAGLVLAFRWGERGLAATMAAGVLAHWLLMGRWSEWHGGESFGPRMMTDVLPLLILFLPEGLDLMPFFGTALAALSIAIQGMGAFSYDYRWERIYQRPPTPGYPELWSVKDSPLLLMAKERVVILALPALRDGRAFIREHRLVVFGPKGSRARFAGERLAITGTDPALGDVHLLNGARLDGDKLRLKGRWDGLFLRVRPEARQRKLELRIVGRGRGTLYVGERTFWSEAPRWTTYPMGGALRIRHPYFFPESGGADVVITLGKSAGEAALDAVALVPPTEPENVIEAP
jgi:hypothetical protein